MPEPKPPEQKTPAPATSHLGMSVEPTVRSGASSPFLQRKIANRVMRKEAAETGGGDVQSIVSRIYGHTMLMAFGDPQLVTDGLAHWMAGFGTALKAAVELFPKVGEAQQKELRGAADFVLRCAVPVLKVLAGKLRDDVVAAANASSLMKQDRAEPPKLPPREKVQALMAAGQELSRLSRDAGFPGSAEGKALLDEGVATAQDAALSMLQTMSVMAARDTWKLGQKSEEIDKDDVGKRGRERTELDEIFKDADFGNRIGLTKDKSKISDWCGMFVGAHLFRGGGIDEELRAGMLHVDNVKDYFHYTQKVNAKRTPKSIWADNQWWEMRAYHEARGSLRQWKPREAVAAALLGEGALDIRPGDVVLIDHGGGNKPSHITMVESYDPGTKQLVTIEGNTGGIRADADGEVPLAKDGVNAKASSGRDGVGLHVRDLTTVSKDVAKKLPKEEQDPDAAKPSKDAYKAKKGSTVFGVGRPSVVDFEEHSYASNGVSDDVKFLSPEQMREKAKEKGVKDPDEKKAVKAAKKVKLRDEE